MEGHFAIPAGWEQDIAPEDKSATPLVMLGTSFKEPSCPNDWCRGEQSIKWSGPAEDGVWIDPMGKRHEFHAERVHHEEL